MKTKTSLFLLILVLLSTASSFASTGINIAGVFIPVIEGASHAEGKATINANVETLVVDKPLAEVVAYYSSYLKQNGFMVIGGESPGGFDASVKKDNSMFTVKIYSVNNRKVINFIW